MEAPRTGIEAFCGRPDSEARSWMHKPWIQDGKVYATNGHILIEAPMVPDALLGAVEKSKYSPNNIGKMFDEAFAAPVWRKLPKLPAFDPCPQCNGTGMIPAKWRFSPTEDGCTCDLCEGYGETYKRIEVGDTGFCIRYMRVLASFPDVLISPNGMKQCAFTIGSGDFKGRGLVMPMRTMEQVREKYGAERAAGVEDVPMWADARQPFDLPLIGAGYKDLRIEPRLGYVAWRAVDVTTGEVLHCAAIKELLRWIAKQVPRQLGANNFH